MIEKVVKIPVERFEDLKEGQRLTLNYQKPGEHAVRVVAEGSVRGVPSVWLVGISNPMEVHVVTPDTFGEYDLKTTVHPAHRAER